MRKIGLYSGITLVALVIFAAALSMIWTPYDPTQVVPGAELRPASWAHPMGTDGFGIDILSRILAGARICVQVGVVSVTIAALIGVPLGLIGGLRGGWLDELLMRAADIAYAFPALLLAIIFAGVFGPSTTTAMIAIGIATIPAFARITRAGTVQVAAADYVMAGRAAGSTPLTIARKHILPNVAPVIGVQASISFAMAILAEAGLSYLGLATPPPTPTWGRMLHEAQNYLFTQPILAIWPGLAIAIAVLGFNLLGDGLRDHLDPTLREVA